MAFTTSLPDALHDGFRQRQRAARWVARLSSDWHKKKHLRMARYFPAEHNSNPLWDSIATVNKPGVSFDTPETERHSEQ